MTAERVAVLEKTVDELKTTVSTLESTVAALNASVDARIHAEVQLEQTLRNIDDNIHILNEKVIKSPLERVRETEKALDPVYKLLRKHEDIFIRRRDVITFFSILVFFLSMFSVMGIYILKDGKSDLLDEIRTNKVLIQKNSETLHNHNNKEH